MPPSVNSQDTRSLVEQVCDQMGLDEFAANTVERWVNTSPSEWASCCMGGCDPCNDAIRSAARKVLEQLDAKTNEAALRVT